MTTQNEENHARDQAQAQLESMAALATYKFDDPEVNWRVVYKPSRS